MDNLEILLLGTIAFLPVLDLINEKYKSDIKNVEYLKTAFFLWVPATLLTYLYFSGTLSVTHFGFDIQSNWQNISIVILLMVAIVYLLVLLKTIQSNEEMRQEVMSKFEPFKDLMPVTRNQMLVFTLVLSVSAGICEELIFRAYLFNLLDSHIGMIAAVILSSVVFGLWHIYLGWKEVIRTGVVGAFLCGIYILTENIILPILLHIFIDVYSGLMCYFAMKKPQQSLAS